MQTQTADVTKWNKIIPFFIVLLCAVLEPRLITEIMTKVGMASSNLYRFLTYLIIGCWILVIWLLISLIPHLFSLLYDAEGKFKELLFSIGYGFLPMLVGLAISFWLSDKINVSESTEFGLLEKDSSIQTIALISKISMSLSLPWVIYCLHLNNKISLVRSVICVGVPFGIMYLLSSMIAKLI